MTDWLSQLNMLTDEHRKEHPGCSLLVRRMACRDIIVHCIMQEDQLTKSAAQDKLNNLIWEAEKPLRTYTRRRSE